MAEQTKVTRLTEAVKMLDERNDLCIDLYRLALAGHGRVSEGVPCDEEIECQECTLLLIASEELGQPDPFERKAVA